MTDAGPPRAALSHLRRSRARSVPDSSHAQEPTAPRKNLPALRAAIHLAQEMGTCLGRGALLFRTLQKGGGPNFAGIDAVMRRSMGKRARGRPLPWIRRGKSRVWVEEVLMDTQELVAQMIIRTSGARSFEDWPEVLAAYAALIETVQYKLTPQEMEDFINLGADFYRTLARAEDYRRRGGFAAGM